MGLLVGAAFGATWLGGHLARESSLRAEAGHLNQLAALSQSGQASAAAFDSGKGFDKGAMHIAMRFSRLNDTGADNPLLAQNLNALHTSNYVRTGKAQLLRASLLTDQADTIIADHPAPLRAASAFALKAHNQNDADCLTQAVYYEARGEGTEGMRAVAQVILNRVRHPAYPKSICSVVYQGAAQHTACQFSFVCNGAMTAPVKSRAWKRARNVADAALNGYVMKAVGTATSFHTVNVHPSWSATMQKVAQIGSHIFYQFRGRATQIADARDVHPSTDIPALNTPAHQAAQTALLNTLSRETATEARPVAASAEIRGQAALDIAAALHHGGSAAPAEAGAHKNQTAKIHPAAPKASEAPAPQDVQS
ncbi:cell wall hydrolase [Asticcacaulis sp. EMRT-3]|uniref:cell wall hydrolase n=1 Tax=Asticcacaulis sp. EMRT-3 TaxID=3040349 RepID=UPI0024AF173B|nr:cell wall hydrolase [Asticcacaulis sp. EMRT-3]MDI7776279.1 cell wall hydrolase [Asticcacaulis sp. EMRT-3]